MRGMHGWLGTLRGVLYPRGGLWGQWGMGRTERLCLWWLWWLQPRRRTILLVLSDRDEFLVNGCEQSLASLEMTTDRVQGKDILGGGRRQQLSLV